MNVADLTALLWPQGDGPDKPQVHMLIDGATDMTLSTRIRFGKLQYDCLFGEPLSQHLRAAAPYLVHLSAGSPQTCDLLGLSANAPLCVFVTAPPIISTRQLRLHFKKLLWVHDERGRQLYFRYYDPRVLAAYWPSCSAEERVQLLGPGHQLHWLQEGRLHSS